MTAFIVPMDAPGVEVRPIRQMSGGASFNEVFFTDVRIPDRLRLGDVGAGWKVALTTLGFERGDRTAVGVGGSWAQVRDLARWSGRSDDPLVRQALAELYARRRITELVWQRATVSSNGGAPGPEASIGKLRWTQRPDAHVGDRVRCCSAHGWRPTPVSGARFPGTPTSSARPAIASLAGRTRSNATSSASGCSASPPSRESTETSRGKRAADR